MADRETNENDFPEVSEERLYGNDEDVEDDLDVDEVINAQYEAGRTYDPRQATEEGLAYTPPRDPPVVASEDDPQGAEIAAGFAPSMEDSAPNARVLPPGVDGNDLDVTEDIYQALRDNSETAHLTGIKIQVDQGVVSLLGTVASQDDIPRVYTIVSELDGVLEVRNHLTVALDDESPKERA